jgi:alpha-L-rhamnosidase
VLGAQYEGAKRWVDLVDRLAGPGHLWDSGMQLGDWLDPAAPSDDPAAGRTDPYLVATAYFAWSTQHLAQMARVTGRTEDADRYTALAADIRVAFQRAYRTAIGTLSNESATAYSLAIVFHLLDDDTDREVAGRRLAELVRQEGYRIATGFIGTPIICDALTGTGQLETAYKLLLQRECPSWLYPVLNGATTMWERWDSLRPDGTVNPGGMTSFNHYALGAVADWMHRVIGGLSPTAPGYRNVLIRPQPGGGITACRVRHTAPYGDITVDWTTDADRLNLEVTLAVGITGSIHMPDGTETMVTSGRHQFACDLPPPSSRRPWPSDS